MLTKYSFIQNEIDKKLYYKCKNAARKLSLVTIDLKIKSINWLPISYYPVHCLINEGKKLNNKLVSP